jgi:hypothetical protein
MVQDNQPTPPTPQPLFELSRSNQQLAEPLSTEAGCMADALIDCQSRSSATFISNPPTHLVAVEQQ